MSYTLITGASSGIGACTALEFAKNNKNLILIARNESRLNDVKSKCLKINSQIKVETLSLDLQSNSEIQHQLKKLLSTTQSPIENFIHNAGIYELESIENYTETLWQKMFQLHILSANEIIKTLWGNLKNNSQNPLHTSSIVFVSSTLAHKPLAQTGAYSATKAAQLNLVKTLAHEGAPYNIRANAITPGIVDTPIHSFHNLDATEKKKVESKINELQLLQRLGKPEDIATAIYFLCSENSSWITGTHLDVDGGINIK